LKSGPILVVDDNADVRLFVRASLELGGYAVIEAADGLTALKCFEEAKPVFVILDLSLGQPDGLEVCRQLRQKSNVPIIILTSRTDEIDEAMCLAAGADDYVTKPVSGRVLLLRVAAQLRRAAASHLNPEPKKLVWDSLELDLDAWEVRVNSKVISLTPIEFDLLRLLMESPRRVFTREQVAAAIGSNPYKGLDHALDTHASRLRLKIRRAGGPEVIVAIRGVGYRLASPE